MVVQPVALLVTGFLAFIIIGPVALLIGTGITSGVTFIFQHQDGLAEQYMDCYMHHLLMPTTPYVFSSRFPIDG
ncbi:hypothetical protein ACVPOS_00455 [Staphylococcus aureus]